MTDRYAVMGNPIAQSKSPWIHTEFARQTGEDLEYSKILVPLGAFAEHATAFFVDGGRGLNITAPFKLDACALADVLSDRARLAGAVNTLSVGEGGRLYGDNTDGVGIVRDLCVNHNVAIRGKRLLLLGAGGAVRGVLGPLLEQDPAEVTIANRTAAKAVQLADLFAHHGRLGGCGFATLDGAEFDVVINGTAAGLAGEVPDISAQVLANGPVCYDMTYSAESTNFSYWAIEHGASAAFEGLGMLVEQAAESFYIWRGIRPATAAVIKKLRGQLT